MNTLPMIFRMPTLPWVVSATNQPVPGGAVRVVMRPQQPRFGLDVFERLFLVPGMVTVGEHVHAGAEQLGGGFGRDAGAVGDVFGIRHDEVEMQPGPQPRQLARNHAPAGLADDIADEKGVSWFT